MKLKAKILTIVLALAMLFSIIGVFALPASAATPTKLYLKPNSNWTQANARFAAYFFGNGETWVDMTDSDADGIYEVEVPAGYPNVIFCRMNPSTTANNWSNKWNQTADLTIGTNDCYTVKDGTWDSGGGTWSKFTAPVYRVAGAIGLVGVDWDVTNNNAIMTDADGDGTYTLVLKNVTAGTYGFKIAVNGTWDVAYGKDGGSADASVTVAAGNCNVTISFTPATKSVSSKATSTHTPNADDGDCTTAVTCKDCGATTTPAKSHVAGADDGDCTTAIKCSNVGCTQDAVAGNASHTAGNDDGDCTTAIKCSNAGCTQDAVAGNASHTAGADDGDCTTPIKCVDCDQNAVAAKSHTYDNIFDLSCNNTGCTHEREACQHPNTTFVKGTDATCTTAGVTDGYQCNDCQEWASGHEVIPALGHKDDNNDHTCDNNCGEYQGVHGDSATDKDHVCDYGCGATLEACSDVTGDGDHNCDVCNKADVTSHSYAPATCTAPKTCSECGATTGVKLDHDYSGPANNNGDGTHSYKCINGCENYGNKKQHVYVTGVCECEEKDYSYTITVYFQNNWNWTDVRCYYWDDNGKVESSTWPGVAMILVCEEDDAGHQVYAVKIPYFVTGIIFNGIKDDGSGARDQSPNIVDGWSSSIAYYMDWDNGNKIGNFPHNGAYHYDSLDDTDHDCDDCGKEDVTEHVYVYEYDDATNALQHTKTCNCGDTADEDHTYEGYTITTNAGCTTNAFETGTCVCGKTHTREIADTAAGHNFNDVIPQQNSTCLATGRVAYKTCKNCDKYFFADATKFAGGAAETSFNALTTAGGFVIAQLDHDYSGDIKADDNGTTHSFKCENGCDEYGEATAHVYDKKVAEDTYKKTDATCTAKATYYYSCECGAKGTNTFESGEMLDHIYNRQVTTETYKVSDATCTAKATYYYSCECGAKGTNTFEFGEKLGHNYENVTPFYRVEDGVLYQVTQCERYGQNGCTGEEKTKLSGMVEVSNEADLRVALYAGYSVKLTADIDLNAGCINLDTAGHDITIDLNGHKLVNNNVRVNEVVDVLWVKAALTVTITDSATGGAMKALGTEAGKTTCVISATDGAIINIESGSFYSEGCTTIYATRGGKINISGGHYKADDPSFLIDINEDEANENYGTIVITGGQFVDFNPANHTNDKPVSTNKILDGYHAIKSEGVYTVGEHNYVAGTPVPVTCTTDGYTLYTCACGDEYKADTVSASGHSFGEVVPKVDATCIDNGHEAYKQCTVCSRYFTPEAPESATGNIANTFITNQLEHSYTGEVKADDNGTTHSFKCINGCNEYGAAVDHADSATDNDHECDTCGEVLEECSDATGDGDHNCDVCGKENVSDHDWAGNTCTAPQTCNECGATSGEPKGHKFTTNITCDNGCGTKAAAKVGENYYITVAKALETAKTANVKDLVITIVGENDASTADNFDLLYQSIFDSVILKQENGDKVYYFYDLYTGTRTNNGEFTFDGVNIVVTDQYMFEGNVRLANNSFIKSVTEANCFFYYSVTTVEPGSKLQGVIDDLRGGTVIVDGGRTDGEYNTTPDMQDAIIYIRWSGDSLTVKNGAYVKINSANEVGRLTVSAGTSLNVYDSKVDSYQWIENNGTINVDVNSLITTGKITGSGKIVIDAADYNDSIGQVIDADLSGFTGEIEVINCEGLFATVDGNGRLTFTKAVASIGNDYYLTLQDAFNAVENGETIVLARDFELSATAVAPAVKFTIDLNGKTVTSADDYALNSYNQSIICVTRGTDLTINDSIGGGCLDASELYIAINLTRYGDSDTGECAKLTVNAGKYLGGYYAIAGNGSKDNTYIEINDGQFIGDISAIYHPQEGTLVITGGSFVGNGAGGYGGDAIGFLSGSLEISGGTFEGKTLAAVSIENIGGTSGYQEIGTVSITGGTFISAEGYDSITSADEGGGRIISFISGGTFNTDFDLALLVDGLALKQDGESYTVVNAVAQIKDGYGYASLADAVAAAQANDVINLLANDTITETLDISKSLTIDTGAFDITSKADVAFNITASNVTFTLNGKVIVSDPDAVANARSGGVAVAQTVLTMDDVADVTAILDAEFELGAGDVIYSGPVDNISLSVRDDYEAALNKKGYVTKDSTTPGMVDVTAKSLYYIGDDGYWYFDDVKTGVLAKGENGQSITITSYDKQPVKDGEFVVSHNYVITFSDGTEITINVPVARSIVNVEYDRTEGNKDIYVITYSDGSTSEFTVTNGTNGHSPVITIENGEWCIDGTPTGIKALGKDGKGIKSINKTTDGLVDTYTIIYTDDTEFEFTVTNGRGIVSISLTSTSADGLVDTYTITYNDGTTSTFTVTNGANGINGIQGEKGDDGHTPVITIQNGKWHIDGVDTGMQAQGVKGETGNGISDISKTGIDGLVDTYTITYTDGTKTTFTVTNGAQGAQGIQGIQGVPGKDGHTPVITIGENGNWFIDGADTGVKAEAIKGETGAPGADGEDGDTPYIGENGNWWIDGVDTGVKAEGKDGNDNNKIIIICIGIAALCIITTIVAVATKKFRRPWWILC